MDANIKDYRVKGLVAATFTPLKSNFEVDYSLIKPYAEFLLSQGVKSIFVNGTTGEGANLSIAERKQVAEKWTAAAADKLDNIMIHVGGGNVQESVELASHAEQIGAHAIGLAPPTYFKPPSKDALLDYCRRVAAAAPNTPFFYYHIPSVNGVNFLMDEFMDLIIPDEIPTFRGIKYSHSNYMDLNQCLLKNNSRYTVLFGCDQELLCALALGVDAAIGSTYNYMPRIYQRMMAAYERGDMTTARAELNTAQRIVIAALGTSSPMSAFKVMMKQAGFDVGPVRPALVNISVQEAEQLKQKLLEMEFEKHIGIM